MELITQMILSGILSAALSIVAYKFRMLTSSGAIASFLVGYVVGVFGSVYWLILLVAFTLVGLAATKMNISDKKQYGLQEGDFGERTHKNVLGVGFPACLFAFLYGFMHLYFNKEYDLAMTAAFITVLSVAAADTVASEIGIRDRKVWLITTFERVKRGTDGGVSVLGTLSSIAAAAFTSIVGWLLIFGGLGADGIYILVPITMGIAGSLIDSVLGATLERKGRITKYTNNSVSALAAAWLGVAIILFL
ncbi:MAG: DUF92 domain-containing protein [Methanomassiliicoccaceae archaeon]|nr:DUF92 domain-containing protein [Methanomassiliicoccaceae archaeon]